MKTRTRRGLSLILALMMIFSASGIMTVLATEPSDSVSYNSAQQIVTGGLSGSTKAEPDYYNADGSDADEDDFDVALTKTVKSTMTENVFDIELKVVTTQDLEDLEVSADAAVVLVMDVSNSMKDKIDGTSTNDSTQQRITLAKAKAVNFVNSYVTGAGDAKRMFSLVEFGSNAMTVSGWLDANSGQGVVNSSVTSAINGLAVNFPYTYGGHSYTDEGGTNIEGGLMLARNLLTAGQATGGSIAGIKSVYVILLSDGEPTYHVSNSNQSTTELSFILGERGGGSYSTYDDFKDIPGIVSSIQSTSAGGNSAKVIAVCFASDGETMRWKQDEDDKYSNILITTWLASKVGVSNVVSAISAADLGLQLSQISTIITKLATAWVVTDEMGGNILFDASNFDDVGVIFSTNSSNIHYYDSTNRQIVWDVKNDAGNKVGNKTTYTLEYRVDLNTAASGFVAGTAYPTNGDADETDGSAQLKYLVLGPTDNLLTMTPAEIDAKMKTAAFTSPTVKGFLGSLSFNKTKAYNGAALPGATFQLAGIANGVSVTRSAVSGPDGKVNFTNLPSGYTYTLTETAAATGFNLWAGSKTLIISGGAIHGTSTIKNNDTIENELDPGTKTITITKTWNVPTGTTLPEITVNLFRDSGSGPIACGDFTMSTADAVSSGSLTWSKTLTVDKFDPTNGVEYAYTVTEDALNGYTPGILGLDITNTITGEIEPIRVTKQWILPEDWALPVPVVTIELLANGDGTDKTVTLTASNPADSFENLDEYDGNGVPITYSVDEDVPDGYDLVSITGDKDEGFFVTNTLSQQDTDPSGTKTWKVPAGFTDYPTITVQLYADGVAVPGATKTLENGATPYKFEDLPRYLFTYTGEGDNRKVTAVSVIEYTVKEGKMENDVFTAIDDGGTLTDGNNKFTVSYSGMNITNTITGTTEVDVTKKWIDLDGTTPHGNVTINLMTRGGVVRSVSVGDGETETFEDLPMYDELGQPYVYTVQEVTELTGYTATTSGNAADGFVITNKRNLDDTITVQGSKNWAQPNDLPTPQVRIGLYADGKFKQSTMTTSSEVGQGYKFTNLPEYKYEQVLVPGTGTEDEEIDGVLVPGVPAEYTTEIHKIVYTILEGELVEGEFVGVEDGDELTVGDYDYVVSYDGYNVTNTVTGTTSIAGTKNWVDEINSTKPKVTINLYKDGEWEDDYEIIWPAKTYEFTGLKEFDDSGRRYSYTVEEVVPELYSSEQVGYNFTNTLKQVYKTIAVDKQWIDGNAEDRPDIRIDLYRSDDSVNPIASYTMESPTDRYTFTEDKNGNKLKSYSDDLDETYTYSVKEVILYPEGDENADRYETVISGTHITNSLKQKKTFVQATKIWVDPKETHDDVTFTLTGRVNGEVVYGPTTKSLAEDGEGNTVLWSNLDVFDENREFIVYDVDELEMDGYTSYKTGTAPKFTFTNVIDQETVEVKGEKTWDIESSGQHNPQKPSSIWVQLYRDDIALGSPKQVTPDEGNRWFYSFTGLVRYAYEVNDGVVNGDGDEYVYTVKEGYKDSEGNFIAESDGKITFGSTEFTVTYREVDEELPVATMMIAETPDQVVPADKTVTINIINTYNEPSEYFYRIDRNYYTHLSDGTTRTDYAATGATMSPDGSTLIIKPTDYETYPIGDGASPVYGFTGATIKLGESSSDLALSDGELDVEFNEANQTYIITLNYTRNVYKLSVIYHFTDNRKPSGDYKDYTDPGEYAPGDHYTTVKLDPPTGYRLSVPSDASGTFGDGDTTVTYTYSPRGGGNDDDDDDDDTPEIPETPETPETPEIPEIIEIPEEEVPLEEIPEVEIPLAEPPYTGDEGKLVPLAVSMLISGAGLVVLNKKRKEEEAK